MSWSPLIRKFILTSGLASLLVLFVACPGKLNPITPPTDSTSASEIAEALVSGTVNATFATGTQARNAPHTKKPLNFMAELLSSFSLSQPAWGQRISVGICPEVQAGGPTCVATTSPNSIYLPLAVCNYSGQPSTVTWSGSETITNAGATVMNCSSFPAFANGDVLTRSFGTPTTRMETSWLITLLDTSGYVAGNPGITATGMTISYSGAVARTIVINGIHVVASISGYVVWNYMVSSGVINVDATNTVTGGTVTIQDLVRNRTDTSTLAALTYTNGICMANGGAVSTTFSDQSPTETLTFTGNGNANLNGNPITLTHCW